MSDNIITRWYFEFRSKPLHITVICMDPHSPNKLIATKCCFLILGDDTNFLFVNYFFVFRFFFLLFYFFLFLLIFTKIILLLLFYLFDFFFHENYENYFYFSMFRDAPVCSGMLRVLSTPLSHSCRSHLLHIK